MSEEGHFEIKSSFTPMGDQPRAITALAAGLRAGSRAQTLLGATGTGKTFTMANVIEEVQRPTLIISHNKTLAAQLYEEMRELFPNNAVSYFVSYYDYYQPEAYIPQRDIYIEKDASRNQDLDRLRLAATSQLLSRRDVIIVASVSCIFGLGSPTAYGQRMLAITQGATINRREIFLKLLAMQYKRNDIEFQRGNFRVRGDIIEVFPAYEQFSVRIELFGDEIERIELVNPISGELLATESHYFLFPAQHYVLPDESLKPAIERVRSELQDRLAVLQKQGKLLEAQRLAARTRYDIEMLEEIGFCSGIENYSAPLEDRSPGDRPSCLLDYFNHVPNCEPSEWLVFIDESHVTIPQIRAMYNGDRARKQVLVDHGFRLPSALDNRPLTFDEFSEIVPQIINVSATPAPYELQLSGGEVIEQVIRPTGILDPNVEVHAATAQVPHLIEECQKCAAAGNRVLVTVLTKRLAEQLTHHLDECELRVRFLHSDIALPIYIDTLDRLEILRELREGQFDVLIGVNLLREGLDLPEVALVCILDADKTGFLRSETSLVQTIGRAARHVGARVILYADRVTPQMQAAMDETSRRRVLQEQYNQEHGIQAKTVKKAIRRGIEMELQARRTARTAMSGGRNEASQTRDELIEVLEREMLAAADKLDFEKAASIRDEMEAIRAGADHSPEPSRHQKRPGQARSRAGITKRGKRKSADRRRG
mgnify:CR=1 FL=1